MLRGRCSRIDLEHFEAYSFNRLTRQRFSYKLYEVWILVHPRMPYATFVDLTSSNSTNLRSRVYSC